MREQDILNGQMIELRAFIIRWRRIQAKLRA